ncbi:MAG TPA: hypothetical protein VFZ25_22005, partial [Chloroflexota bacterium]|nr:hypothetical protein [Chloroflexota bacterium]
MIVPRRNALRSRVPRLVSVEPRLPVGECPFPSTSDVRTWRDAWGVVRGFAGEANGGYWIRLPGIATFRFSDQGRVRAFVEADYSPAAVDEVYHREVLPVALQATGTEVLHASAVRFPSGVVAFCAGTQVGKSTLAFGLSRRGFGLWADDAVAFEVFGQSARAIPVPFQLRLRPASAAYFGVNGDPELRASVAPPADPAPAEPAPLGALWVVNREARRAGAPDFATRRLRQSEAFPAILAHAYCFGL